MYFKNIRETGIMFEGDEPTFHQLVVSEDEMNNLLKVYGSYESIRNYYNVDFISVCITTDIDFIHATSPEHKESIDKFGLIMTDSEYIPDLGKGIYGIDVYSEKGFENLKTFISEKDIKDILIIEGNYVGDVEVCVYGERLVGSIVIKENVEPENLEMNIYKVDDFLNMDITEFQYI